MMHGSGSKYYFFSIYIYISLFLLPLLAIQKNNLFESIERVNIGGKFYRGTSSLNNDKLIKVPYRAAEDRFNIGCIVASTVDIINPRFLRSNVPVYCGKYNATK